MTTEKIQKKVFILTNSPQNQPSSKTELILISRPDGEVWAMGHIFLNPDQHAPHELSQLLAQVVDFVQKSGKKLWPLDPLAIQYLYRHPELKELWYNPPFSSDKLSE